MAFVFSIRVIFNLGMPLGVINYTVRIIQLWKVAGARILYRHKITT